MCLRVYSYCTHAFLPTILELIPLKWNFIEIILLFMPYYGMDILFTLSNIHTYASVRVYTHIIYCILKLDHNRNRYVLRTHNLFSHRSHQLNSFKKPTCQQRLAITINMGYILIDPLDNLQIDVKSIVYMLLIQILWRLQQQIRTKSKSFYFQMNLRFMSFESIVIRSHLHRFFSLLLLHLQNTFFYCL